jgi:pentachlorophenol monooxygenase
MYADSPEGAEHFDAIAAEARQNAGERISVYTVLGPDGPRSSGEGAATIRDPAGTFRAAYGAGSSYVYVIRPDGYVGYRAAPPRPGQVAAYLSGIIAS